MAILNREGLFVDVNPAWTALLGWTRQELIGQAYQNFVHPDDWAPTERAESSLLSSGTLRAFENRYRHKIQGWRHIEWSARFSADLSSTLAVGRDISRTRELEKMLSAGINASLDAVFFLEAICDAQGKAFDYRVVEANERAAQLCKMAYADLIGQKFGELYAHIRVGLIDSFEYVRTSGMTITEEYSVTPPSSATMWFHQQIAPTATGVALQVRNITTQKHLESELKQALTTAQQYRAALDRAALTAIMDAQGNYLDVNANMCRTTGYHRDELLATSASPPLATLLHDASFSETLQSISQRGGVWSGDMQIHDRAGNAIMLDASIVPIFDEKDAAAHFIMIAFDVTIRRRTDEQLAYASRMSSLGEMSSGIAHEINNPLTIIQGYSERLDKLMSRPQVPIPEARQLASRIQDMARRIANIVAGLRAFSREASSDPFTETSMNQVVASTLEFCRERFRAHGIDLRIGKSPVDLTFRCRSIQVAQVLLNLLNNAYDAVSDQANSWVEVNLADLGDLVEISVTDSGPLIPESLANKIMVPFFTTKGVGKGTGLGLSISKGLVEGHGGHLILDRSAPVTRFVVRLPKDPDNWRR